MPENEETLLSSIEIDPPQKANSSVIWLHGLGADGNDFAPIVPELRLPSTANVRFIFPHAPVMPVTINSGYEMRAWFDIYGVAIAAKIDETGIEKSVTMVEKLIEREMERGIPTDRIILAGFSQGAVIALTTGLRYPSKLAGILALSGYLPLAEKILPTASAANRQTPIFIAHGIADPIVQFALGNATSTALTDFGYPVSWHSYPMPHSVCAEEIRDIGVWMGKVLG